MNHDEVTNIITRNRTIMYGVGITPNPFESQQVEWVRRHRQSAAIRVITDKIISLFEPRFITPPETSECIASIVTMTDSRKILEVGTCTGFTSLHILRAIIGKQGAKLTTIDARPAHDQKFFDRFPEYIAFVEGWTPEVLATQPVMEPGPFDLVFVDSDHSVEHTQKEVRALWNVTRPGTVFLFHDLPEWQKPTLHEPPPVRTLLMKMVRDGMFDGTVLPTSEQLDCLDAWGPGYPKQCNPHLGILMRK